MEMTEGDYGLTLPITISGATIGSGDSIKITIKRNIDGKAVLEKTFTSVQNNTINFELTEEESESLPVGDYVYALDWYQDDSFMCNIIKIGVFKVVNKA